MTLPGNILPTATLLSNIELGLIHRMGWLAESAREQIELLKVGVRDHRIADDTIKAIEIIRYGA